MFALALELFCIQLGYFDCQSKITSLPGFYALGRLFSLLLVIYPYSYDINREFETYNYEVVENRFYSVLQLLIDPISQILSNPSFQNYVQFVFNLAMFLGISIVLIANHITKDTIEKNIRKSNFKNIIMKLITFFFICISVAFSLPLLIIALQNLKRSSQTQDYAWLVNDIVYVTMIHLVSLFYFVLLEGTLIVKQGISKKLQVNFQDYVTFLLQMIQPYIFVLSSPTVAIYGQSIIYLLVTFLELISIYIYQQYSNKLQKLFLLIIHSCGIIIAISAITQIQQPMVYMILLSPLLLYIGMFVHNYLEFQILTSNFQKLNLFEVNNLICSSLSAQQQTFKQICILNSIYKSRHSQQCQNVKCQCQLNDHCSSNTNKMIIIPDIIEEELYCGLLGRMKRLLQNQEPQDCFYFLIHFLYAQQYHGEVYEIYSKVENKLILNNLSYLQRIKWKFFIMMIKQNLYTSLNAKLNGNHLDKTKLSIKINQFVQSESFNQSIKDGLINIIQQKLQLQQLLVKQQSKIDFTSSYYNLMENVEKQEKILKSIYDSFPSQRNQSQLMFFYAEIKYDWKKAFDQLQINAIDNSILNIVADVDFNRLANKMAYLIYSYDDRKLKIISYSKKAPAIFGFQLKQFELILTPDILIPSVVRDIHDQYIIDFLQNGKGNYFRQVGQNFCQLKSGFMQNIEFFFDLYFDSNQSFRFITFLSCHEQADPMILVDSQNKIQGINKELFKKLNFHPKIVEQLTIEKSLYNLSADLFIQQDVLNGSQDQYSFQFYFPKESFFSKEFSTNSQKTTNLKNYQKLQTYEVNCEILRRKTYKIIKLKKIQENCKNNLTSSMELTFTLNQHLPINEEELIVVPYEYSLLKELSSYQMIQTQRKTDVRILSEQEENHHYQEEIDQIKVYHYSESNAIDVDNKTIKILGNVYENDAKNQENIVLEGSQASSMAGLRKSVYYRKYTLVNQLNELTPVIPLLNKIFGYLIFALINQVIFLSINVTFSRNDFHSLNYYYQSIQINHYFIEPMQKFFLARYMLQDYQILNLYQSISKDKLNYYLQFINPLLIGSYDEFKLNFQDHFQDETFSTFIEDQYVLIQQQTYHYAPLQLQEYNVTLFNAFSILLDAFYKQEQIYIKPQTTKGTNPHNTYQYKNYILFVTIFDNISDLMYQESISKTKLVVDKWIIMVVPISIIVILSLLLLGYYYNYFNNYLEKFFDLNAHIDQIALDADQNRQQFILQSLKQGSELIHLYKFNMIGKEEMLAKVKVKESLKEIKNVNNEVKEFRYSIKISKLPLLSTVFAFIIQYVLISGSLTLIGTDYMSKFSESIHFFKSISDIGVYVPASFSQKEILYFFSYFTYYTNDDRAFFVDQIQKAVTKIDTFLKMDIESSKLQFSTQFLDNYEYLQQNNLCPLLNSSKYYDFDYFCPNSQNGVLKLGLTAALTNFNNILKTELSINFPSTRKLPPKEELEAVYLCSDIISEITAKMEQDIQSETQTIEELYNIINSISLTYTIILILVVQFTVFQLFKVKLNRTKMISLIFPLETIFLNDHFERELRRMVTSEKLI
ncbi:unnamed protein product (macronuclear) [Paramecium tetraurelia]|uniref:PAS domain-containing protein n=1 Tax=Paramecium tetraurelia TaxID=5888 RepID=A0C1X9_PARTE|nr:uncharacterized protein GSPATT00034273001 [Paramecium tetraurelia]CAK64796.1 unnamed protein product [Paramecium tetraurelia]|eukprot:XP_001432193.1 hypothetical protein (macronuclear) [Paramecium tetraurelia strain d4-2]